MSDTMTSDEVAQARTRLGELWRLDGPLTRAQMAALLQLSGFRGDQSVGRWEAGKAAVPGPAAVAIRLMLAGAIPPHRDEALKATAKQPRG